MTTGPIQLVVLGFEELDRFRGQILAELQEVRGRDVIRLLDLLFVARDEAGQVTAAELSDLPEEDRDRYGALLGRLVDLDPGAERPAMDDTVPEGTEAGLTSEEVRQVAATLEPGTAAALLLVEHRWAARLAAAVRGAALVDALAAAAEEELVEEAAAQAVADAAEAADVALRSAAAADVVRALVAAGVLEDTAALEAVDALVAAGLIDPGVVQLALEAEPGTPGGV